MSDNLRIYNAVRAVPDNACRQITAGRLKGKTDVNPMWRIQTITEQYGPCGIGWKYTIDRQWLEAGANGEIAAFCNISLFVKENGEWSEAIPGTGGSMFVAAERNGLYTSDECFKMALTDAYSVACKALGVAADVYWQEGSTKYSGQPAPQQNAEQIFCSDCKKPIQPARGKGGALLSPQEVADRSKERYGEPLCLFCSTKRRAQHAG